jgi:uncharacterized protein
MNRFVIDTNVIISAILFSNSTPAKAINLAKNIGVVLISFEIFEELEKTLTRKKFYRYLSFENRRKVLTKLLLNSSLIEVTEKIDICRDQKDNKFLELAVNGQANIIITGDQDLLVLNPFREINIMTPETFINQCYENNIEEL